MNSRERRAWGRELGERRRENGEGRPKTGNGDWKWE
jgi:hypothetical protein